jgi:hypothetical protein
MAVAYSPPSTPGEPLTLKVEDCFGVVCSDPEKGEFFELGAFATAEQTQIFLDLHEEWRRHPEIMCDYCSGSIPLDAPTAEDIAGVVS